MGDTSRLAQRMLADYLASPRLKLTVAQMVRRWSATEAECRAAIESLAAARVVWLAPSGRYVALPSPDGASVVPEQNVTRCPHCRKRNSFQRDQTIHGREVTISLRCVACQRVFSFTTAAA